MKKYTIKKKEIASVCGAIKVLAEDGELPFDEWIKVEQSRLSVETPRETHQKLVESISKKTGYDSYAKKAQELFMKGTKTYSHTDQDLKAIAEFKEGIEKIGEEEVEITIHPIPEEVLKNLPTAVLKIRGTLLPFIETTPKKVK